MIEYHYVYVLRSLKDKMFYVGFTHDITKRVNEHKKGIVPSTRARIPFELIYWEGSLNQQVATRREKYLKTAWGKPYIRKTSGRNRTTFGHFLSKSCRNL